MYTCIYAYLSVLLLILPTYLPTYYYYCIPTTGVTFIQETSWRITVILCIQYNAADTTTVLDEVEWDGEYHSSSKTRLEDVCRQTYLHNHPAIFLFLTNAKTSLWIIHQFEIYVVTRTNDEGADVIIPQDAIDLNLSP